jgi:hypothetical protein
MSRYYFHFRTEAGLRTDMQGMEFGDTAEAIVHAYLLILRSWRDPAARKGLLNAGLYVTDKSGSRLFILPVSSVVSLTDADPSEIGVSKPAQQHAAKFH